MTEVWRVIPSYPMYEASSYGRIRSMRPPGRGRKIGHILRPSVKRTGYLAVSLTVITGEKMKYPTVHALVAEAFIGPRPVGKVINHKDCDKKRNTPENLEYVTRQENETHARVNGRKADSWRPQLSADSPTRKLQVDQVVEIRNLLADGMTQNTIACRFGVSQTQIGRISRGVRWGWLK